MKWILLTTFLLVSCASKIVNHREAYVLVYQGGRVLSNGEYIQGKQSDFSFSFVSSGSSGLKPIIYINGNITARIDPLDPDKPIVKPDITYQFSYRFKKPGRAVVMLIWESKNHFGQPFMLHLNYD